MFVRIWDSSAAPEHRLALATKQENVFRHADDYEAWRLMMEKIDAVIEEHRDALESRADRDEWHRGYLRALRDVRNMPSESINAARMEINKNMGAN